MLGLSGIKTAASSINLPSVNATSAMLGVGAATTVAGGLAGARIGSNFATTEDQEFGSMAGTGAMIGAGIGAAAVPLSLGVGEGAVGLGKRTPGILEGIGGATISAGKRAVPIAAAAGKITANVGLGLADFASTLVKESKDMPLGYKISGKGKAMLLGAVAIGSIIGAHDTYTESRMGTPTGLINSTPQMPVLDNIQKDMAETYGAGGDLNFAMHRNRRG